MVMQPRPITEHMVMRHGNIWSGALDISGTRTENYMFYHMLRCPVTICFGAQIKTYSFVTKTYSYDEVQHIVLVEMSQLYVIVLGNHMLWVGSTYGWAVP